MPKIIDGVLAITKCVGSQSNERQRAGLAIYPVSRQLRRRLLIELPQTSPARFLQVPAKGTLPLVPLAPASPITRVPPIP